MKPNPPLQQVPCPLCGVKHEAYCAKCRAEIKGRQPKVDKRKLLPLLYWDWEKKAYRFGCTVRGCPCNQNGLCVTQHFQLPVHLFHPFDGDNCINQVCG